MRFRHPRVIGSLFSLLLLLTLPEAFLQVFDPWKTKAYFGDLSAIFSHFTPDATRGVVLTPGDYTFSNWSAHVNADGNRAVPDTVQSACRIAFLGDSVTFGYGVSDKETWVNDLAPYFPKTTFVNTGVNGYNASQAAAAFQAVHASGYLYLMVNNDADKPIAYEPPQNASQSLYAPILPVYLYVWNSRKAGVPKAPDYRDFDSAVTFLEAQSNVTIVGFTVDAVSTRANVPTIAYWDSANSVTDGHADAKGNVEIAEELRPFVAALVRNVC
jgi:hypothetical protein